MYQMERPVRMTLDIAMLDHVPQEMTSAKIIMDHVCMRGRVGGGGGGEHFLHICIICIHIAGKDGDGSCYTKYNNYRRQTWQLWG